MTAEKNCFHDGKESRFCRDSKCFFMEGHAQVVSGEAVPASRRVVLFHKPKVAQATTANPFPLSSLGCSGQLVSAGKDSHSHLPSEFFCKIHRSSRKLQCQCLDKQAAIMNNPGTVRRAACKKTFGKQFFWWGHYKRRRFHCQIWQTSASQKHLYCSKWCNPLHM